VLGRGVSLGVGHGTGGHAVDVAPEGRATAQVARECLEDRPGDLLGELLGGLGCAEVNAAVGLDDRHNDGGQCREGPLVAGGGLGDERGQTGGGRAAVRLPRALPAGSQPTLEADDHAALGDHHGCSRSSR